MFVNAYSALVRGAGRSRDASLDELLENGAAPAADADAADTAADSAATAELRAALEDCLDALDPAGRELAWLHFVDGRSKRDLARALDRPESSVRLIMVRVLQQLRRCLAGKGAAVD